MTNEEAKVFLDNLKICINEHPIVADWLVEIADRKTENCSEIPNNSKVSEIPTSSTISKMEQVEPQTDVYDYKGNGKWEQTDCPWK